MNRAKTRARRFSQSYGKAVGLFRWNTPHKSKYGFMVLGHAEALAQQGHATLLYRAYPDGKGAKV